MPCAEIRNGVFSVGAVDWDRRLFDELIPLPEGTSYNAYLVRGEEKNALIDTVDPSKTGELIAHLRSLGIDRIDYIIAHHAEQDHSGSIPEILRLHPEALLVTNAKCRDFLMDLLDLPADRFRTVADRETLSLGKKTLEFYITPWVHWPETMITYLKEDKILFTCDLFGSHLAASRLYEDELEGVYRSAKRYYAEIMMPFRSQITSHLEKIDPLKPDMIAPSHGPVYRKPGFILDAYRDWTSDAVKEEVVLPFVSMHGSTRVMADHLIASLMKRGIEVKPFNLTRTDLGELAIALVDASTVVLGSPMVLAGPHPVAVTALYLVNALRPKTRFFSLIGSFGWGGRLRETVTGMLTGVKAEILEPVLVKGHPRPKDLEALDRLADLIRDKHAGMKILPGGQK